MSNLNIVNCPMQASVSQKLMYAGSIDMGGSVVLPRIHTPVFNSMLPAPPQPNILGSVASSAILPAPPTIMLQNNAFNVPSQDGFLAAAGCTHFTANAQIQKIRPFNNNIKMQQTVVQTSNQNVGSGNNTVTPPVVDTSKAVGKSAPNASSRVISVDITQSADVIEGSLRKNISKLLGNSGQVDSFLEKLKNLPQLSNIFRKNAVKSPQKKTVSTGFRNNSDITYTFRNHKRTFTIPRKGARKPDKNISKESSHADDRVLPVPEISANVVGVCDKEAAVSPKTPPILTMKKLIPGW